MSMFCRATSYAGSEPLHRMASCKKKARYVCDFSRNETFPITKIHDAIHEKFT